MATLSFESLGSGKAYWVRGTGTPSVVPANATLISGKDYYFTLEAKAELNFRIQSGIKPEETLLRVTRSGSVKLQVRARHRGAKIKVVKNSPLTPGVTHLYECQIGGFKVNFDPA